MTDVIELLSSDDDDNYAPNSNQNNSENDTSIEIDIEYILNKYKNINNDQNTKSLQLQTPKETISSSDNDDDNYVPNFNKNNLECDTTIEIDIADILNKYKNVKNDKNTESSQSQPSKETISSSDDDDNFDDLVQLRSLRERLESKYLPSISKNIFFNDDELKTEGDLPQSCSQSQDQDSEETEYIEPSKPKKRRSVHKEDKNLKKLEKEQEKERKQAEKEKLKAETAKAKAEKQAIASAYKNLKPDECIKFITALIDSDLMSSECSTDIPNVLQNENISYKINSNVHPFTITWKRNNQAQLTNIGGHLKVTNYEDHCDQVLLILMWNEFVTLVHKNNLCNNFKTIQSLLPNKKVFLGIYGLENYFRFQKSQKQKQSTKDKIYASSPKISRKDVDMSLIELQILFKSCHRFLETPQDMSAMVLQFTKSIAQIPYKLEKQLKQQQMDWFVSGDNKDCVRVDKNGNGLYRLWQQQLTQFTMARLETAEAVTSKYPSPSSLMKAYEECETLEQGEKLLQDIPVRRAAGPLTSVRKIGFEFSKKIYTLFTSVDGEILL